jgi:Alcohol dehydrogenase GroES-like domain
MHRPFNVAQRRASRTNARHGRVRGPAGQIEKNLTQGDVRLAVAASTEERRKRNATLQYSINVTLDGCCDHRAMSADEELFRHLVENFDQADALLFGRVTLRNDGLSPANPGAPCESITDLPICSSSGKWTNPFPRRTKVLIAIHATTVSTGDCNVRNFTFVTKSMRPIAKLMFGIGKPWKERILGTELAGEVEGAGQDVTRFKPGDRIVASTGMAGGGHAQYACLPEAGAVVIKPDSLSWDEVVAIPFGANTALYFLRNLGTIRAGQELLIIGASGAIGSAGVQLAKHFGAKVTGVCSGANVGLVKSLGADTVID